MLAENLILLRNMKGMSQEQIAEVIGISRQSYAKWEQGETVPDIENVIDWQNFMILPLMHCFIRKLQ